MESIYIGNRESDDKKLFVGKKDFVAHVHSVGKSRSGKSKMIEHIVREFEKNGQGFILIDPNGSLVEAILEDFCYIEPDQDIYLFAPSNEQKVIGFNPFRIEGEKTEAEIMAKVDRMVGATIKAVGGQGLSSMPSLARILPLLYYVLIEQDLPINCLSYFTSPKKFHLRDAVINRCQSEAIQEGFEYLIHDKKDSAYLREIQSSLNRINPFITNPTIKRILGLPENSLDIKKIVDSNGILLCNMQHSKTVSREACRIIGTLLVNEIWEVMSSRTLRESIELPKTFLIMDEFQTFITPDIAEILDQAAKFGLHLQLYHQNLGQLPKDLMVAITSCHTRFVFSGSNPPSAKFLLSGSEKSFEAEDIQDDFKLIESLTQRYFVLKRPEKPLVRAIAPWVHHYEMDLEEVEEYIQEITTPFLTSEQVDKKLSEFTRNLVMKLTPDEPQAKPENDDETAGNAVSEVKEGTATAELADDDLLY